MNQLKFKVNGTVPSVNHYCVTMATSQGKVLRFPSKESNKFKNTVRDAFKKDYPEHSLITGDVTVVLNLGFKTPSTHDVDNYAKVPLDALTGHVYEDDKQITCLTIKKFKAENNHIEIEINY